MLNEEAEAQNISVPASTLNCDSTLSIDEVYRQRLHNASGDNSGD